MSVVEALGGVGSEAIRLSWREDENGRKHLHSAKPAYSFGNGMTKNIKGDLGRQFPRWIPIESGPKYGLQLEFNDAYIAYYKEEWEKRKPKNKGFDGHQTIRKVVAEVPKPAQKLPVTPAPSEDVPVTPAAPPPVEAKPIEATKKSKPPVPQSVEQAEKKKVKKS